MEKVSLVARLQICILEEPSMIPEQNIYSHD
jgi:hypothetical protein